jgi:excisionase family DNA binding protein
MPRSTPKSAEIESKPEATLVFRETLSASEAALKLGVAPSTVKEMARAGELDAFKTLGGHWRFSVAGIEEYRTGRRVGPRLQSATAPVSLLSRREHVDDLTLRAQEIRARQQLSELQDEQTSEADRHAMEAQARRLERQRSLEQVRADRQQQKRERQQAEAEQRREAIREQVLLAMPQALDEACLKERLTSS